MKRNRNNPAPNITFYGDNVDRLLNCQLTPSLKEEVRKVHAEYARSVEVSPIVESSLIATPPIPLVLIMHEDRCDCGSIQYSFGYLAEKKQTPSGSFTMKPIYNMQELMGRKPKSIEWLKRYTPYCHDCIPSGLNNERNFDSPHSGATTGRFSCSHPNAANGT